MQNYFDGQETRDSQNPKTYNIMAYAKTNNRILENKKKLKRKDPHICLSNGEKKDG